MGTMESLPQEFHQVIACNSEQEHIKDADAKPLKYPSHSWNNVLSRLPSYHR